jgi:hypothetical protein
LANSGLFEVMPRRSALPPKADINGYGVECLLLTQRRHGALSWISMPNGYIALLNY